MSFFPPGQQLSPYGQPVVSPSRPRTEVMAVSADAQLGELRNVWEECKAQNDKKTALVEELFKYIHDLRGQLYETDSELQDKKDATRAVRAQLMEVGNELNELKREKDRTAFAVLLIDGDSVPFQDDLVQQGMEGGKKAASLLKQAVEENIRLDSPAIHHLQLVIKIYANVKGLAKIYKQAGVISDITVLDNFVRGLNMGYALCDYVDAGDGKECSDEKVKAMFKLYFYDMHCRHIVFGGSADNGYARMLEPYLQSQKDRSRISLLEGPHFAPELHRIKDKFRTLSFPEILRGEKLLVRGTPVAPLPPQPVQATPPVTSAPTGYASATTRPAPPPALSNNSIPIRSTPPASRAKDPETGILAFNAQGQRVDLPLTYSKQDFFDLKALKLCNNYHLTGYCHNGKGCTHEHGDKLGPRKLTALRALARTAPCNYSTDCDDPFCINGHRCVKPNCIRERCWFDEEMHDVDTKVVTKKLSP